MNFATFDLNLLRVFDALMRDRGVTRAGERIGLSQPAVSAALGRLRVILGDQLFTRAGNRMVPTPRAEDIAPAVAEALARLEGALFGDDRFDPATADRTFTLQGADFFSVLLLPRLARRIAREAPLVRLRMRDTARGEIEQLLRDDAIDLSLEPMRTMPDWVETERLMTSPFVAIAARDEPLLEGLGEGETIPLDRFCAIPQAIRSVDGSMDGVVDEALARLGVSRRVVLALPNFHAVATAVAEGGLIAALPEEFARERALRDGLSLHPLPATVTPTELGMHWRRRNTSNPAHAWLRRLVRETCADFQVPPL